MVRNSASSRRRGELTAFSSVLELALVTLLAAVSVVPTFDRRSLDPESQSFDGPLHRASCSQTSDWLRMALRAFVTP